jgi:hypothetical protein
MGKEKDRSLHNGIIAAIVGAIIVPLLTWLFGWSDAVLGALAAVWRFFLTSSSIPRWLLALWGLITLWSVYALLKRKLRELAREASGSSWRAYTRDVFPGFDGAVWRWQYSSSGNTLLRAAPFCPRCDMVLFQRYQGASPIGFRTTFLCEHCRWESVEIEGSPDEIEDRVKRLIDRKVRSGEWEHVVRRLREAGGQGGGQ